jgi:long-chain acyl-CoA synthetase
MSVDSDSPVALWHTFKENTQSLSKRTAISTVSGDISFEELYTVADRFAEAVEKAGIGPGSVTALALPNSPSFVPALLALIKLGGVVGLVSPNYRKSELKAIADGVHPQCFLTTAPLAEKLDENIVGDKARSVSLPLLGDDLELVFPSTALPASTDTTSDPELVAASEAGAAVLKFTSGSTGTPKGILLSVDNVLSEARNVVATLGLTPDDRLVAPVPMVHSYGFDLGVLPMLSAGAGLILRDHFIPRRVLTDLASKDVTVFVGVPSMYRLLMQTHLSSIPDLSHIRFSLSGTAHLNADFVRDFHARFGVPICQHYGSSETGAVTNHVPSEVLSHPDSVGLPMRDVELSVVGEDQVRVSVGEEGEIVVRSGAVAKGYIMGKPMGGTGFKSGEFWTGDLGVVDERGYLTVTGRKDEVINVGGFKVSPQEVTRVLEGYSAVREAAVVGVEDSIGGSIVYAAVSLDGAATESEIVAYCHNHLADYKIPRRIMIMDELPRGPTGKIKLSETDIVR